MFLSLNQLIIQHILSVLENLISYRMGSIILILFLLFRNRNSINFLFTFFDFFALSLSILFFTCRLQRLLLLLQLLSEFQLLFLLSSFPLQLLISLSLKISIMASHYTSRSVDLLAAFLIFKTIFRLKIVLICISILCWYLVIFKLYLFLLRLNPITIFFLMPFLGFFDIKTSVLEEVQGALIGHSRSYQRQLLA